MKRFFWAACFCLTAAFTTQVNAEMVEAVFTNGDTPVAVSATDLLTGLESGPDHNWAGAVNQINDGVQAAVQNENGGNNDAPAGDSPQRAAVTAAGTYTFDLDVSTNTLGYDITSVDVFSSWQDGRAGHGFELFFSTDGGATFTSIIDNVVNPGSNEFVATSILDTDGAGTATGNLLGTGVTNVRFDIFAGTSTDGTAIGNASGSVFREIDVIGTATAVPEPSSMVVLAGLGLVFLRRRK